MSSIAVRFSRAIAAGRKEPMPALNRERVLVSLLHKRAAAQNVGAEDMEVLLRSQIRWSLPTFQRVAEPIEERAKLSA